jgi:putative ABC transport system permease protein
LIEVKNENQYSHTLTPSHSHTMISLFFKTAFRNLSKRKGYAALNIFGLTLGMTSCLLIFKYVAFERSYDSFQPKSSQIYRVQLDDYQNGKLAVLCASNYAALAPALKKDFPEIEEATRFFKTHMLLSNDKDNIRFSEDKIFYAEPAFLDMFGVHLIEGDVKSALEGPEKIVISEDLARKYFNSTQVVGRTLNWKVNGYNSPLLVTGVYKNYPGNSHIKFSALVSYKSFANRTRYSDGSGYGAEDSWFWTDFYTYIRLKPGADPRKLQAALPAFAERHVNNLSENLANHDHTVFQMIALQDIHLYSHYTEEAEPTGDGKSVAFLYLIGFIILGIAWVNYINMATARSLERAREVGVRKLLGAVRRNLILQFMVEGFMINFLALVLAAIISFLLMKPFGQLTGKPLGNLLEMPPSYILAFGGLFLTGSFISGIYPAFVLSGFNPVTVLKGLFKNSGKGQWLRKGLIVGQFATSILLISGTIIIYRQLQFMRKQNLGVNIDQTIVLHGPISASDSVGDVLYQSFTNDVLAVPGVRNLTSSSTVMGQEILWATNWKALTGKNLGAANIFQVAVDYDFIPGYEMKLLTGRNFSKDFPADKKAIVINANASKLLGYRNPEEALHQTIISMNDDTMQVVGVVADFHQEGLQKEITPLILMLSPRARNNFSIKMDPRQASTTIGSLKKIWDRYYPSDPFGYFFLDEFFARQYDENKRFGDVFGLFSMLAIVIACLGLLALSAYNVLQRTKEIGIRKVLGASVKDLVTILSKDFMLLVMVAFVLAIPFSVWIMSHWLQSFAYRVNISWWIYAIAGIISFSIALLTIGFQAVKAALGNPVDSLRTE